MGTTNNAQSNPIDLLLDLFVKSKKNLKEESAENYKSSVPFAFKSCKFSSDSETYFLTLLPKLLKDDRKKDIQKLIDLIRCSVALFDWGNNKKSYKTYIRHFLNFIEKIIYSKKFNNIVNEIGCKETLSNDENDKLKKDLSRSIAFSHKILFTKFKSRLRTQERTSGDKIWLPIGYIAKIYKTYNKNNIPKNDGFSDWLNSLVNGIYIHYKDTDDNNQIKYIKFGKNQNIGLKFNYNEQEKKYDVYISKNSKEYPVYTPTGVGNKKEPMIVKSISEIDIDHIKPIDLTLRELGDKGKIGTLEMVSDSYKDLIYNDKNINTQIDELINDDKFSIVNLTEDLKKIKKDTVLRLMDSKFNENKSNGLTYEEILLRQDGTYIGILGHIDEDDEGDCLTIYQELIENGIIRATKYAKNTKGKPFTNYKKIINYI